MTIEDMDKMRVIREFKSMEYYAEMRNLSIKELYNKSDLIRKKNSILHNIDMILGSLKDNEYYNEKKSLTPDELDKEIAITKDKISKLTYKSDDYRSTSDKLWILKIIKENNNIISDKDTPNEIKEFYQWAESLSESVRSVREKELDYQCAAIDILIDEKTIENNKFYNEYKELPIKEIDKEIEKITKWLTSDERNQVLKERKEMSNDEYDKSESPITININKLIALRDIKLKKSNKEYFDLKEKICRYYDKKDKDIGNITDDWYKYAIKYRTDRKKEKQYRAENKELFSNEEDDFRINKLSTEIDDIIDNLIKSQQNKQ